MSWSSSSTHIPQENADFVCYIIGSGCDDKMVLYMDRGSNMVDIALRNLRSCQEITNSSNLSCRLVVLLYMHLHF